MNWGVPAYSRRKYQDKQKSSSREGGVDEKEKIGGLAG